ncbi:hypothetical protein G6K83_11200 [Agrobacterium rhizogenes]|uniref:hypothetical protein n=1 Tax=Rhizobium rhizogenes TaxID=359 RepID=UPI00157407DD|nr:hypothetical protein [Rhizobium rhizogenes]NTH25638.1 hypothetical protein [Rhizobium rhizogenes]
MSPLILTLCAVVCTYFVARFFAAKARLAESAIDKVIAQKLEGSPLIGELDRLREENGVMRNLLIDMIENEASMSSGNVTEAELARAVIAARRRRREIFGEAAYLVRQTQASRRVNSDSM